jgi:hypothetical protein
MRRLVYILANARYIEIGTIGSNAVELSNYHPLVSLCTLEYYYYYTVGKRDMSKMYPGQVKKKEIALTAHNGRAIQPDGSASVSTDCSTRLNSVTLPSCWSDLEESVVAVAAVTAAAMMTSDDLRSMVVAFFFPRKYK